MRSLLSSTIEFNSPSSLYLFLKRQIVPLGFALPSVLSVAFINLKISHSTAIVSHLSLDKNKMSYNLGI